MRHFAAFRKAVDVLNIWYDSEDEALTAVSRSGGELWRKTG
jgi:hypothetical protein